MHEVRSRHVRGANGHRVRRVRGGQVPRRRHCCCERCERLQRLRGWEVCGIRRDVDVSPLSQRPVPRQGVLSDVPRVPAGAMDGRRRRCDGVQPDPHARANACAHACADDGADKRADHGTHYGTDAVAHALAHAASMRCVVVGYLAALLHELRRWHAEARAQYPGQRRGAWRAMPGPFAGA